MEYQLGMAGVWERISPECKLVEEQRYHAEADAV